MTDAVVLREKRGAAYWITLNRPERRNALTAEVLQGICDGYDAANRDPGVRAIVLTGSGEKAFCAGADLEPGKNFAFDLSRPTTGYGDLARKARTVRVPAVARINGACVAGGMGLLGMVDIAVAAEHAIFALPEVRIGLFPMQVVALLQGVVSARRLREWCLTGERFDAHAAREAGLITHVVPGPDLDRCVDKIVESLIACSPMAQGRGLYALRCMDGMAFSDALAFAESQIALAAGTDDAREGLAAAAERRPPKWTQS